MHNQFAKGRLAAAVGWGLMTAAAPLHAAVSTLEEIIVTAQKQEENVQAVPMALSALSREQLDRMGVATVGGALNAVPSISLTPFPVSSNTLILYMRGQGNANPNMITVDSAVGLYVDGFYLARAQGATFDLADVERIEVLRGPQGTLYGRNTTGGAVNVISKAPTGKFGFTQKLTFGSRDQVRSLSALDLPTLGGLSTKFTVLKSSIDGYVKNSGSGHDYGEEKQQAGRFQAHWELAPNFAADYFVEQGSLDSTPPYIQNSAFNGQTIGGYPYYADPEEANERTYRPLDLPLSTTDFEGHGLTLTWDATDALTIKSLTGYRELDWDAYQNFANANATPAGASQLITSRDLVKMDQLSQEFQFIGNFYDSISYVAGLYYFKENGSHLGIQNIAAMRTYRRVAAETESKAVFGQVTWIPAWLDGNLELTGGARYTRDRRTAERVTINLVNGAVQESGKATGAANDLEFSEFDPSFTVQYHWSPDVSTYLRVANGYRAGGSYEVVPPGRFNQTFDPEELTTYEVGLKSYWFDRHVRANVALFDSHYEDMQLIVGATPGVPQLTQIYNAGESSIRGVELELLVAPSENLSLNLDYTYLSAKLDRVEVQPNSLYDGPTSPYRVGDDIKHLLVIPHAPRHSFNFGGDYTFWRFNGGDIALHLDYRWQSLVHETASSGPAIPNRNYGAQRAYGVLNGRVTLALALPRGDAVRVALWGRNLADKDYKQLALPQGTAGVPVAAGGATGYTSQAVMWSEPRSYGVDLAYRY